MRVNTKLQSIKQAGFSFRPDFAADSIEAIDFKFLAAHGIKACFLDLDGTVVSRSSHDVSQAIQTKLAGVKLPLFIATNRPANRELKNLQQDLSATGVIHPSGIFPKPSKRYYRRGLATHNLLPHEVVMIGDRYLQDVLGANRAGLYSLVITKNGASIGVLDRLLSRLEAALTRFFTSRYRQL